MPSSHDESPPERPRQSPIGLAFDTGSDLPRLVGEVAGIVERRAACVIEQGRALLGGLGLVPKRTPPLRATTSMPAPAPAPADGVAAPQPSTSADGARSAGDSIPVDINDEADADDSDRPNANDLSIPAYDSLSASQVVPRLASLQADELESIRAYEAAGRARRTILNRIDQLRSA